MIYLIEAFDKESGFLAFEEELPTGSDQAIKTIMGWTVEQQGWEGYDLSHEQLGALEKLLGKEIHNPAYKFQLSCNV
ncbi:MULTISPECIES: DUF7683 domain-containing protein [Pseudomonas]|uniref:DUF7683 domain-containing protein n=1 Tax=Pseudomonas TaxID=286 RepID=UPI001B33C3D3|nr:MULTISPECIES: hypothetical protein [Pseudomonas]MBP5969217.1 hypothetical protein [Pseudomonas iridis]UHC82797.1 hypothetical protein LS633_02925 [Pseudomonas sp. NIBR-H-19]